VEQLIAEGCVKPEFYGMAIGRTGAPPGEVRGNFQRLHVLAQIPAVEVPVFLQRPALQLLCLPGGIVFVLYIQRRRLLSLTFRQQPVKLRHFLHKHLEGPAIRNDMMHGQQEDEFPAGCLKELCLDKRTFSQIEAGALLPADLLIDCLIPVIPITQIGIDYGICRIFGPMDDLPERVVDHCKGGPEALMPADEPMKSAGEGGYVKRPVQPESFADHIGRRIIIHRAQ